MLEAFQSQIGKIIFSLSRFHSNLAPLLVWNYNDIVHVPSTRAQILQSKTQVSFHSHKDTLSSTVFKVLRHNTIIM